jgi:hypothetical protein
VLKTKEVMGSADVLYEILCGNGSVLGGNKNAVAVVGETNSSGYLADFVEEFVCAKDLHLVRSFLGYTTAE